MSQQPGYSEQAEVIVDVTIIGIGITIVVEVVTPSSPPNIVALDAMLSPPLQEGSQACCCSCLIHARTSLDERFYDHVAMAVAREHVVQPSRKGC